MVSSKTTATTVRLPNDIAAYLRRVAAETGKSQSQIVTEALAIMRKREQEEPK